MELPLSFAVGVAVLALLGCVWQAFVIDRQNRLIDEYVADREVLLDELDRQQRVLNMAVDRAAYRLSRGDA